MITDKQQYLTDIEAVVNIFQGFLTPDEFKEVCLNGIDAMVHHKSAKIIADTRELEAMPEESQKWVQEVWFGKAGEQGLRTLAFIVPSDIFGQMSMEMTNEGANTGGIEIRYFDSLDNAKEWIGNK